MTDNASSLDRLRAKKKLVVAEREGVLLPVILELVLKRNTKGISLIPPVFCW